MAQRNIKELSTSEYWDAKYSGKDEDKLGEHEWFRNFETLRPFLKEQLPAPQPETKYPRILHLGCGTSAVSPELQKLGYNAQDNIDFSPIAIETMIQRHGDLEGLTWKVMDVRHLAYDANTFDIAFDKGTLDAMLWGSLWDPEDEVKANVKSYVDEVARCLKPGGRWLYVTYRQPHLCDPSFEGKVSGTRRLIHSVVRMAHSNILVGSWRSCDELRATQFGRPSTIHDRVN